MVGKNYGAKELASGDMLIEVRSEEQSINLLKQTYIGDLQISAIT